MKTALFNRFNSVANKTRSCAQATGALALMSYFNVAHAGLDAATDEANEVKLWAYGFLGVLCFIYLIYLVVMTLLDKRQWGDVLQGVGYVALAGGIIVAGEWAWAIWGS